MPSLGPQRPYKAAWSSLDISPGAAGTHDCICSDSPWDKANLGVINGHHLFIEAIDNHHYELPCLVCRFEASLTASVQGITIVFVKAVNETLFPVSDFHAITNILYHLLP